MLINRAGSFVKVELEAADGTLYQVEMDRVAFAALKPAEGELVWVRAAIYRTFKEE